MFVFFVIVSQTVTKRASQSSGDLLRYDKSIFGKNYFSNEAKLVSHTHQIEKGLSHVEFRQGFGLMILANLRKVMDRIKDKDSVEYVNALSALKEYFDIHKDVDVSKQKKILGEDIVRMIQRTKSNIGGTKVILYEKNNSKASFDQLMKNRHSIREYSNSPVLEKDVIEAIEIAQKTPTVCNRQSPRVVIIQDSKMIKDTLKLQGGLYGYKDPSCLLLVTVDNRAYLNRNERHQGYIDGGLFTMSLLLALEYKSLASAPLHAMFDRNTDMGMRKLLDIPKSESLIAFVSVGNFRERNKVPKSFRYPVEKIIRKATKGKAQ